MERAKKPAAIPVSPIQPTPQVSISDDNSRVTASLPTGQRVEVLLYGATVISWTSANGKENLFLSSKAILDGSKPVRGGIPLVFPVSHSNLATVNERITLEGPVSRGANEHAGMKVFGPPKSDHPTGQLPRHGFARNSRWEYLGKSSSESSSLPNSKGDASVKLDFGLSDSMIDSSKWNYSFNLTYSVTLSQDSLETSLVVRNTGSSNYDFQVLFHSYLAVDVSSTYPELTNLKATSNDACTRIYPKLRSLDSRKQHSSTKFTGQRRLRQQRNPSRSAQKLTESTALPPRSLLPSPRKAHSDMRLLAICFRTSLSGTLG